jgi:hypothetical protein
MVLRWTPPPVGYSFPPNQCALHIDCANKLPRIVEVDTSRTLYDTARAELRHPVGADAALFEIIHEDELPIDCSPAQADRCAMTAVVIVSASSGYERRPLCANHAHVAFAEWMVGI